MIELSQVGTTHPSRREEVLRRSIWAAPSLLEWVPISELLGMQIPATSNASISCVFRRGWAALEYASLYEYTRISTSPAGAGAP